MKKQLCLDIEKALGKEMRTPKDFDYLRESIYTRLNILISSTTLKRIWGYLDEGVQTRQGTFDILAQFIGYHSYEDYITHVSDSENEIQSSPVMSRRLNVSKDLNTGDVLRILWQPNRLCEVIYLGNLRFRILSSRNTRLQPEDTFQCSLFIEGEPLYLDNLKQGNLPPTAYVCGKRSGIQFESIPKV